MPILLLLIGSLHAQAPSGGPYQVTRQVIATGGVRATGGALVLEGTAGQSTTSAVIGGSYAIQGGFHRPLSAPGQPDAIFKHGFEN